ncbi:MAG: CotH kinase family protein [Bacteroidales bacterium]|nr:CotH kinase family protein [Bacteroidales bacterium]
MSDNFRTTAIKVTALLMLMLLVSCYKEAVIIPESIGDAGLYFKINNNEVAIDLHTGLCLVYIEQFGTNYPANITFGNIKKLEINDNNIVDQNTYIFSDINAADSWQISMITKDGKTIRSHLKFTLLPVVQLFHSTVIPDEFKVPALIKITGNRAAQPYIGYCGIEIRGGQAIRRPKKSFSISLSNDNQANTYASSAILGMRLNNSWILDAMYADLSKMRNRVSFDLWQKILETHKPPAVHDGFYINGQAVEVFANYKYLGLFFLSEKFDEELLYLKTDKLINGFLLYKSEEWSNATKFLATADTLGKYRFWCGWEQKYPAPGKVSCWHPLFELIDYIANSDDEDFREGIFKRMDIDNLIDYFILMNITKATDNTGKNIFLVKNHAGGLFYICPWDLDATWGRWWDSNPADAETILTNNLYERLFYCNPEGFKKRMKERWHILRQEVITYEAVQDQFAYYANMFKISGALAREAEKWPESINKPEDEQAYINEWTKKRIAVLDNFFERLEQ